ncbi:MAG: hypothetical protein IKW39_04765 [Alphaproteobacteria bacterium]|nr:hypothetical protein [Alphaproteobacteria bacterium]
MIFKHTKIISLLLLLTLPLLFLGIKLNNNRVMLLSKGSYFFDKTRNSSDVSMIVIKFDDNKSITISKKNDLWHIKEADDYYVSFAKINTLVSLIRNTIIFRADPIKKSNPLLKNKGITIQSFNNNMEIIDEAFIFEKHNNNKNHYALLNGDNFLYQINGEFNISSNPMEWVQMPILKISNKEIQAIRCDKFNVYRKNERDAFISSETQGNINHIDSFINNLWYLVSNKIYHFVNFKSNEYKKVRQYEVELFNGIIYKIIFYKKDASYVVNVTIDKKLIMSKDAANWLEENSVLYHGWFFEIDSDKGDILANFSV